MMSLRAACSDVEYQYESVTIKPHNGCLVLSNMSCSNCLLGWDADIEVEMSGLWSFVCVGGGP